MCNYNGKSCFHTDCKIRIWISTLQHKNIFYTRNTEPKVNSIIIIENSKWLLSLKVASFILDTLFSSGY